MNGFTNIFMGIDHIVLDEIYKQKNRSVDSDISEDEFYNILINYGKTLFDENQLNNNDTDWIRFGKYITLNTFNIYFFKSINYIEDRYSTFEDLFNDYPELEEMNNYYAEYTKPYNEEMSQYRIKLKNEFTDL